MASNPRWIISFACKTETNYYNSWPFFSSTCKVRGLSRGDRTHRSRPTANQSPLSPWIDKGILRLFSSGLRNYSAVHIEILKEFFLGLHSLGTPILPWFLGWDLPFHFISGFLINFWAWSNRKHKKLLFFNFRRRGLIVHFPGSPRRDETPSKLNCSYTNLTSDLNIINGWQLHKSRRRRRPVNFLSIFCSCWQPFKANALFSDSKPVIFEGCLQCWNFICYRGWEKNWKSELIILLWTIGPNILSCKLLDSSNE